MNSDDIVKLTGKTVLVTGGDGFIGSHLVEALVRDGARVTAMAQYNPFGDVGWLDDLDEDIAAEVEILRGNVCDAAFMHRAVAGQAIVFHLAALIAIPYSYEAPASYVDTNVTGTLNVLEASRSHGVERVVHTSTSEVYGTALVTPISEDHPLQGQSPYSASKIGADMMAEAFARSFDLPVAILRPFNTYGPRQSERAVIPTVIRQALDANCEAIRVGDITPTRDFNYVGDTVDAFRAIGASEAIDYGRPYNTGTGVMVSVGEMIERVRNITGTNKPVESEAVRFRPENSEVRALIADPARLNAATGWTAATDLDAGLEKTVTWWQQRITDNRVRRDSGYLV
jgi:NAD dependent epimerase/dehydratase